MEISSSAITGSMKVGLQIINSHKKPVLEVYHQVRNFFDPEIEFETKNSDNTKTYKQKTRVKNVFIQFTMINIGGERAENIKLSLTGGLKRNSERSMGEIFHTIIPQMASGQAQLLFRFDNSDIQVYSESDNRLGIKNESLTITMEYDAPKGIFNWVHFRWSKFKGKRMFKTIYTFTPQLVAGDLPSAEYA